ncbi:MAG: glutamate formimidoyltransferase [Candidatus Eisenbacteria sp.]|nr:glutamate formimidoyltransferase [Candidatus Eisenbacteria bacterium]
MLKLVECVPNFSEGRDRALIDAITKPIADAQGIQLLDVDPGPDTNRTVVTFIGEPDAVVEAAFAAIAKAVELIDMSQHHGEHARMGATDVCPFVPVAGVTMDDCIQLAHRLAKRVAEELSIPVYLYENAAQKPDRRNLADVRKGEYEGLPDKLKDSQWAPDYGEPVFSARSGATIIGAREFLIAYNINLNTRDPRLAKDIALSIRQQGRAKRDANGKIVRDENGKTVKVPGVLKCCKATGWYLEAFETAQVSMNLTDYHVTSLHAAFEEVRKQANARGLRVTGSELVGLIPKEAMLMAGRYYLEKQGKCPSVPEKELIRVAIRSLGMSEIAPFDPRKKIMEYQFGSDVNLTGMTVSDFADELSADSPAPGGGSVSALLGSLAASLTAMVANLTFASKEYRDLRPEMTDIAAKAQAAKEEFLSLVNQDTEAFNMYMAARRLPRKTDADKARRETEIQEATRSATLVPLNILRRVPAVLDLARSIIDKGMQSSVSDGGVAAAAARAAAVGACYNVRINLPGIEDKDFVRETGEEATRILNNCIAAQEEIAGVMEDKLKV